MFMYALMDTLRCPSSTLPRTEQLEVHCDALRVKRASPLVRSPRGFFWQLKALPSLSVERCVSPCVRTTPLLRVECFDKQVWRWQHWRRSEGDGCTHKHELFIWIRRIFGRTTGAWATYCGFDKGFLLRSSQRGRCIDQHGRSNEKI